MPPEICKCICRKSSVPNPAGGACSFSPNTLAEFKKTAKSGKNRAKMNSKRRERKVFFPQAKKNMVIVLGVSSKNKKCNAVSVNTDQSFQCSLNLGWVFLLEYHQRSSFLFAGVVRKLPHCIPATVCSTNVM